MFTKSSILILTSSLLLHGCSGNSSGTSSNLPPGSVCPKDNVALIDGILVSQLTYDDNVDQCLSPDEQKNMNAAVAKAKLATMATDATAGDNANSVLTRFSVQGNAEISDNKVQIHPLGSMGKFSIYVEASIDKDQSSDIRIEFGNQSGADQSGAASDSFRFTNLPEGNSIIAMFCQLGDNLSFTCSNPGYFLNNKLASILMVELESENGENFENTSPQAGFITATSCVNDVCFENYVSIPASFN
ncbi:MAG: hypothetical protein MK185_05180 [Saccharospirillaceae bacterium]|nr:hypothetical protein [Saccharospirillaceae bacterium]